EIDGFRRDLFRRHRQVAFVLAVLVVHEDDHPPMPNILDRFIDRCEGSSVFCHFSPRTLIQYTENGPHPARIGASCATIPLKMRTFGAQRPSWPCCLVPGNAGFDDRCVASLRNGRAGFQPRHKWRRGAPSYAPFNRSKYSSHLTPVPPLKM